MNNRKTTWPYILAVILLVALSSGFIFDWGRKKAAEPNQTETASTALQAQKLAVQDEKINELSRKIDEQNKLLAAQQEKLSEFANISEKLDNIQAELNQN